MKEYIITGAAGHLGSTIIRALQNTDAQVRGLLLPGEKPTVLADNIRYIFGDVCVPDTLTPLFAGTDGKELTVIHTAGIISISSQIFPAMYQVNVEGTKNLIAISMQNHVNRFVYVSSVHAIPELPKGYKICEVEKFSPDLIKGGYAKTKAIATQFVIDSVKKGLPAVIVHPSGILGPYDNGHNHLIQLLSDYINGNLPLCVKGGYDFVDVRDVARGCLLASEKGRTGNCYILAGHYSTIYDLLAGASSYCNRKPASAIPMFCAKLAVPFIEKAAARREKRPLYTAYSLYTLTSNSNFSSDRAMQELGYTTRPLAKTIRDTVSWLACTSTMP